MCSALYLIQEIEQIMTRIVFACRVLCKMHVSHRCSQIAMAENELEFGNRHTIHNLVCRKGMP